MNATPTPAPDTGGRCLVEPARLVALATAFGRPLARPGTLVLDGGRALGRLEERRRTPLWMIDEGWCGPVRVERVPGARDARDDAFTAAAAEEWGERVAARMHAEGVDTDRWAENAGALGPFLATWAGRWIGRWEEANGTTLVNLAARHPALSDPVDMVRSLSRARGSRPTVGLRTPRTTSTPLPDRIDLEAMDPSHRRRRREGDTVTRRPSPDGP